MRRSSQLLVLLLAISVMNVYGQESSSKEAKIENAISAAPPSISANAQVLDWPSEEGGDMAVLREGTNAWTCLPDMPGRASTPMCIDDQWMKWVHAYMTKSEPNITGIGFGYMLQATKVGESNVDPYATGPTADNEWIEDGVPHLMLLVPNEADLAGISRDPDNGGPWVMWEDTPYVHIMAPMPEYDPETGNSK